MKHSVHSALLLVAGLVLVGCGDSKTETRTYLEPTPSYSVGRAATRTGFGFEGIVSGFPTGIVRLTGGGSYDPATATNGVPTDTTVHSGGGFRCLDGVAQGPLTGCAKDEGVRWDTAQLLATTPFKCSASADEPNKTATTSATTVVLLADFYRAGDANDESFTAKMIVSASDLAPEIDGVQNIWIQGVGCATGVAHFN